MDKLRDFYHKKGYSHATIELDEGRLIVGQVIITIHEGPRTKIQKVIFSGNEALSDRQLQKIVKTRSRRFLFFSVYYDQEQLDKDTETLLEAYQKDAYLDAKVDPSVQYSEDQSKATVTFLIQEGPAYLVDSIVFRGYAFFDEAVLRTDLMLQENNFFSADRLTFDTNRIRNR